MTSFSLKTNSRKAGLALGAALSLTAAVTLTAGQAAAEEKDWYASLFAGAVVPTGDVDYTNGTTTVDTGFSTGFTFGGALGYKWNDIDLAGFTPRTEIEVNYSENNVSSLNFSGNGPGFENVFEGSQASSVSILGNIFIDGPELLDTGIVPYVGGGVGLAITNHNVFYNAGLNLNDDGDTSFTWHVTGGVKYPLTDSVSLFTDVGFRQIVNASSERRFDALPIAGGGGGLFEDDINSVYVRSGLTIGF